MCGSFVKVSKKCQKFVKNFGLVETVAGFAFYFILTLRCWDDLVMTCVGCLCKLVMMSIESSRMFSFLEVKAWRV